MAIILADDFTAANGTSLDTHSPDVAPGGSAWSEELGNWSIQDNAAKLASALNRGHAIIDHGVADLDFDADVAPGSSASTSVAHDAGLCVRWSDVDNYWTIGINVQADAFRIVERNAATETVRASASVTILAATTYVITAQLSGSSFTAQIDGGNEISYGSATLNQTSELHGVHARNVDARIYDYSAEDGAAGAQTLSPTLIASTATVYSPTLAVGAVTISPSLIASTVTVYSPTVTLAAVTISPSLIASTATVYAPVLTGGASLLLYDIFDGTGLLSAHNPAPIWSWDNWQPFSSEVGELGAFTLNGSGGVANTYNPASGTHFYGEMIQVASNENNLEAGITTPASGAFVVGIVFRLVPVAGEFLYVRLNSTINEIELVHSAGTETVLESAAITLANNTAYVLGAECVGDDVTAYVIHSGGTVSTTPYDTGGINRWATVTGIIEFATATSLHSTFTYFSGRHADGASATATRIFYAPADADIPDEWDGDTDNSGTASSTWNSTLGIFEAEITANNTGAADGVRFDFHAGESGQTPAKRDVDAKKNLPDIMLSRWYVKFPLTQRLGNFHNIWQAKQRVTAMSTSPLLALNLAWDDVNDLMVTEVNNNIDTDGTFNNGMPDLSTENFVFPANQWNEVAVYYRWHATDGRFAVWLNGDLIYDFDHIRTMLSAPPEDLNPDFFERNTGPANYSDYLFNVDDSNNTVTMLLDNYAVSVPETFGDMLPSEYPSLTISPTLIVSTATVYAPTLTTLTTLAPSRIESTIQVFAPIVTTGAVTVAPNRIESVAVVFEPTVTSGLMIAPSRIESTAAVYSPTLTTGAVTVSPARIESAATLYAPTVTTGAVVVSPSRIESSAVVYAPTLTQGAITISPSRIESAAIIYAPTLVPGLVVISPNRIESTAIVHVPTVQNVTTQTIQPDFIGSSAVVYAVIVSIYTIARERVYTIPSESREFVVPGEVRIFTVASEDRTFSIQ